MGNITFCLKWGLGRISIIIFCTRKKKYLDPSVCEKVIFTANAETLLLCLNFKFPCRMAQTKDVPCLLHNSLITMDTAKHFAARYLVNTSCLSMVDPNQELYNTRMVPSQGKYGKKNVLGSPMHCQFRFGPSPGNRSQLAKRIEKIRQKMKEKYTFLGTKRIFPKNTLYRHVQASKWSKEK